VISSAGIAHSDEDSQLEAADGEPLVAHGKRDYTIDQVRAALREFQVVLKDSRTNVFQQGKHAKVANHKGSFKELLKKMSVADAIRQRVSSKAVLVGENLEARRQGLPKPHALKPPANPVWQAAPASSSSSSSLRPNSGPSRRTSGSSP